MEGGDRLDIISDSTQRELWAIIISGIGIYRDGRRTSIRTPEGIEAHDKEATGIKRPPAPDERAPPIHYIRAAGERMAYHHHIIAGIVESSPGLVGDGDSGEGLA